MKLRAFLQNSLGWSRRKSDEYICSCGVNIDGAMCHSPWVEIDSESQLIKINDKKIELNRNYAYIIFNKPEGVVCSHNPQGGDRSIFDLLPEKFRKLKFAGRLDKNSRGLVILSNDGYFLQCLSRPEYGFERKYEVSIKGILNLKDLEIYSRNGWFFEGQKYRPFLYKIIAARRDFYKIEIFLKEGKKREIRNLFKKLKCNVDDLLKIEHGPIKLNNLKNSDWIYIPAHIINKIRKRI